MASSPAKRAGTLLLLLGFSVVFVLAGADLRSSVARLSLDPSWAVDMENQWLLGRVSGRDFFFTYGPLTQWIAAASRLWRHNPSAIDGWIWTPVTGQVLRYVVTALLLASLPGLRLTTLVAAFAFTWLMPVPWFTGRQLLVALSTVLLARAITAPPRVAWRWGIAAALAGWFGQLFTFEVIIYTVGAWVGIVLAMLASRRLRPSHWSDQSPPWPGLASASFAWLGLQLLTEIYFRSSASTYRAFDYWIENWNIAKGYNLTMGSPWLIDSTQPRRVELALLILVCVVIAVALRALLRESDPPRLMADLALSAASLIVLKGALVRADMTHIVGSAVLAWLFCVMVFLDGRSRLLWRGLGLAAAVVAAIAFGVDTQWARVVASEPGSIARKVRDAQTSPPIDPAALSAEKLQRRPELEWMLAYPFGNHLAIAANRKSLAPIIQSYSAHNAHSQRRFVEELERVFGRLQVLYGTDGGLVWPIDGVPTPTRTPQIFRYLLEHYELAATEPILSTFHLLDPRAVRRPLVAQTLATGPCALLEVDLQIDYPATASLGRPSGLLLRVESEEGVREVRAVPIEAGRRFSTLVFLGGAEDQAFRLFGAQHRVGLRVKAVSVRPEAGSRFSVAPRRAEVLDARCVVPATPLEWDAGALDVEALLTETKGGAGLVRIEGSDLFMHGGQERVIRGGRSSGGACLSATLGWHPRVGAPPAVTAKRDGVAFLVEFLNDKGEVLGTPTREVLPVGAVDRGIVVRLPRADHLAVRLKVDALTSDTWDWALWRNLRVAQCSP